VCLPRGVQAWDEAAAASGGEPLTDAEKWDVAAGLLLKMGDPEAAARYAARQRIDGAQRTRVVYQPEHGVRAPAWSASAQDSRASARLSVYVFGCMSIFGRMLIRIAAAHCSIGAVNLSAVVTFRKPP
jgi:hypothetical protein